MNSENVRIQFSKLSGPVWRDGVEIDVQIYRIAGRDSGWNLEVSAKDCRPVIWDYSFVSEGEAIHEFNRVMREEGVEAVRSLKLTFRQKGEPKSFPGSPG